MPISKLASKKKQRLLCELAEIAIEEQVEEGVFLGTPHYSIIELQARTLGRELSCQAQERAIREVAANCETTCETTAACPTCRSPCQVETTKRQVTSIDGPVELIVTICHCLKCRRSFFPSTQNTGHRQS